MTARYKIIITGLVAGADDIQAKQALQRLGLPLHDGATKTLFPCTIEQLFSDAEAQENISYLRDCGVLCMKELVQNTAPAAIEQTEVDTSSDNKPTATPFESRPWRIWYQLYRQPAAVFAQIPTSPLYGFAFGWLLLALTEVLSLPKDFLWLKLIWPWLQEAPTTPSYFAWLANILFAPPITLFFTTLTMFLLLRLLRIKAVFSHTLAIVGYAQAGAILAVIPLFGHFLSWLVFLWFIGIGLATVYALKPGRLLGFYLLPPILLIALLALLILSAITAFIWLLDPISASFISSILVQTTIV